MAIERQKLVLEIELQDQTAPADWTFNGKPIVPNERVEIKNLGGGKHQLVFNSLEMLDDGEISVDSGKLNSSCKLTVNKGESIPKIDFPDSCEGPIQQPFVIEVPYKGLLIAWVFTHIYNIYYYFLVEGTKQSPIEAKLVKDGKALSVKDCEVSVKDDKVVFKIKKPSRDQSGPYQIKLSNAQGEDVKDVQITMQDVPSSPQDINVKDIFQTSCVCEWKPPQDDGGAPIIKYIVERQDMSLKSGWDNVGEVIGGQATTVKVDDLIPKKTYKFRIRAINKIGSSDPGLFGKPVLAKDPWDEPGKPNNVDVVDWDKDHADLKWAKPDNDGGAPITGYVIEYKDKFGKDWVIGKEVPADCLAATVDGLKEGNQYEFRVKAINKAGPGTPSDPTKPIIAKCRFVKPFIIGDELKPIVVKKGQVIKYDIKVGGEPPPEITWEKDKKELSQDAADRITIEKSDKNTVITVRKSTRVDSGKYRLLLTNSSGTCDSLADVIVLDRPTPPKGPLEMEEIRSDHVKVKWKKPDDSGGSDLTGYVLEKMDMDTGRWIPAGECGPNDDTFTFKGLQPNKKYKFRVKAVNKEGESEPLETTDAILAKNPYDVPKAPCKPDIFDYDNVSATLKWDKPDSDGGRPITHYTIEMKSKFMPEWTEVLKTVDEKCEGKVDGLKENMIYQFRVKAHNKAGSSSASEPTDNHLCKHKNRKCNSDCNHSLCGFILIIIYIF